ncbi:hypothetical protein SAMN05421778_13618 [Sphaerotilus natans]|nr:hypothetical protein SAMN05421778_13618 [Sphaerotilus natans]
MTWATAATRTRCAARSSMRRSSCGGMPRPPTRCSNKSATSALRIGQAAVVAAAHGFAPMRRRVAVASGLGRRPAFHRTSRRLDTHNPSFLQCPTHGQAAHLHAAALGQSLCHRFQRRSGLLGHDLLQGQHMLFLQRPWSASTVRLPGHRILARCTHASSPDFARQDCQHASRQLILSTPTKPTCCPAGPRIPISSSMAVGRTAPVDVPSSLKFRGCWGSGTLP